MEICILGVFQIIMHFFSLFLLLLPVLFVSCVQPKRVLDQMYVSFDRVRYCVRRLNGTHEIGCQSAIRGNSGRMYMIDNDRELNSFLADSSLRNTFPAFIIVLNVNLFDGKNLDQLMDKLDSKLHGMVLYLTSNQSRPDDFSHDDRCPNNRGYGLNRTDILWNPQGTGLFFRSFPFPIMFIDEEDDYHHLIEFYRRFNSSSSTPSCGLELKSFQSAAHTTKTCIRRNSISHSLIDLQETICDPVGGLNIFSKLPISLTLVPDLRPAKSVILILAPTDSFQMFLKTKGTTGGAQQPATALITFLALAHLIGQQQIELERQQKEILFVTLDGDALDYSASIKFLFDIINGYFPPNSDKEQRIKIEHIHSVLEFQALSMTENIWLHTYPSRRNETFINELVRHNPKINVLTPTLSLPPASSQIFIQKSPESSFPVYVFSSADEHRFSNHYYHSFFDDLSTLDLNASTLEYNTTSNFSQWIKNLVEPLAQTLIESLLGPISNVTIDQEIINNLVYCILKNINCPLIHNVTNRSVGQTFDSFEQTSMPFAINTYPISTTPTFPFIENVLGYFLRDRSYDTINITTETCKQLANNDSLRSYTFVGGYLPSIVRSQNLSGYCVRSYTRDAQSMSPAFVIDNYDLSATTYPAWTESRWTTISLRLFIIPTRTHEIITLVIGLLLLCTSFIVLFLLRFYTKISLLQPSSS